MFRSNKSEGGSRLTRQSLETWSRTPTVEDVQYMMDTAAGKRGLLVDVTIKRDVPPTFVLTCQWENSSQDPVWALYEGEDGSKSMWTYKNGNLEMIYEIICMSLPGGVGSSEPSKLIGKATALKPVKPGEENAEYQAAAPAAAPPPQVMPAQGAPYPQQMQPGAPIPGYVQPVPPGYPPGYPIPGQPPYPQGHPQQQAPYPQQQAPYPPQQQAPYPPQQQAPYPPQQPPYQQAPYQGAPQQYPPGYPAGQPPRTSAPSPPVGYPQLPPQQAPAHNQQPAATQAQMNNFIDLLNKGNTNMLLGHLFVEAGVLPEPCLDAALKLQELVRKGLISNSAAIEALRKAAETGLGLDEELLAACRSKYPNDSLTSGVPVIKPSNAMDPREFIRQVISLIQLAGIVTENDVLTAEGVRKKHGGDIGTILVAAGKIERATFDAAKQCQPLVHQHRLNQEEAYRILRHCQKNKSSVDDACRALAINVL